MNKQLVNLLYEEEERVGIITLNRPERLNALSAALAKELNELLDEIEGRDEVRVVIITGARRPDGRPCFCAGGDIKEMAKTGAVPHRVSVLGGKVEEAIVTLLKDRIEGMDSVQLIPEFQRIYHFPKPVIAAIDGICTAGGIELAISCDLRIVSETAAISDLHMKTLGGVGPIVTAWLPRLVGLAKAKEIIWMGKPIDGNEAYRIGFANQVVPPDKLMDEAKNFARTLATMDAFALKMSKLALNASMFQTTHESVRMSNLCDFFNMYAQPGKATARIEAFNKRG